ncbi:MAG: alanine racemase, partial [Natronospirillum sp.]
MSRGILATVHLDNIQHNLAVARRYAPGKRVWAVVKANAYGHGLVPVARHLASLADGLAVATLDEALALRGAGVQTPILLLEGVVSAAQTQTALHADLELVIHTPEQVIWLAASTVPTPIRVWMKLDTGMYRLGLSADEVTSVYASLVALPGVRDVAFMSHYASADEPEKDVTEQQAALFYARLPQQAIGARSPITCSLANSAGTLLWPDLQGDWVRPGIMLYGASPSATEPAATWGLKAGMTLTASVIALR